MTISRRRFLGTTAALAAAMGASPGLLADAAGAHGDSRPRGLGPLGDPDANGLRLPRYFRSRVVARAQQTVDGTDYPWHIFPDGGACYPTRDGGWIYVSTSETFGAADGGVSAIRFSAGGRITDAYRILEGSTRNCAGGVTPWGTWLSCEEVERGRVFECDPYGRRASRELPALGRFIHEAAAVDPSRRFVYLTEDATDGRLYRFAADRPGDLTKGRLQAAKVTGSRVNWIDVPDPSAATVPTRKQLPETTVFGGGEGIWWSQGGITFVTKHDHRLWRLDDRRGRIELFYDALAPSAKGVLGEPDNIFVTGDGDVFVCEDQPENQQVVLITRRGTVLPVVELVGQSGSEIAGVAFNPRGDRMYISSQRGTDRAPGLGITYEIRGPWHVETSRRGWHSGWGRGH